MPSDRRQKKIKTQEGCDTEKKIDGETRRIEKHRLIEKENNSQEE